MAALLKVQDVAEQIRLTPGIVRDLISRGAIEAINVSQGERAKRYRISQQAVDRFLAERATRGDVANVG